jgi:spectinomycin phosphotransferase
VLREPEDLDRAELEAVLQRHWGLHGATLEYLPVGFGSHHWTAEDSRGARWFISVDDLEAGFQAGPDTDSAFAALERAFRTAAALRDKAKLDFVVAPLADDEGAVIRRLSDRYAVRLSPLVEGASSSYGSYASPDDRRRMAGVLGRLHAATEHIPTDLPRKEDFALPSRAALVEALHDLDRPWSSGPFGEPARRLLEAGAHDVERDLREYDVLAARVREHSDSWVITHGEPHRANVIRDPQGGVHLVDWDTTLLAPRERDLRMVLDQELTGWDEYVAVAGAASLHQEAIELYRRWWDLAEIGIYTELFRRAHERTEDTIKSWESLAEYPPRSRPRRAKRRADQERSTLAPSRCIDQR